MVSWQGVMHLTGGPASTAMLPQKACEKRASKNSPRFAVALNWGIGSSSLKAEVKAFDRLEIVRDRNSSYFGSKYGIVHGASKVLRRLQSAFDEGFS